MAAATVLLWWAYSSYQARQYGSPEREDGKSSSTGEPEASSHPHGNDEWDIPASWKMSRTWPVGRWKGGVLIIRKSSAEWSPNYWGKKVPLQGVKIVGRRRLSATELIWVNSEYRVLELRTDGLSGSIAVPGGVVDLVAEAFGADL